MPQPELERQDAPYDSRAVIEQLITEDEEPVDNIPSAKQQSLLVAPLYDSWTPPPNEEAPDEKRHFLAAANIGIYNSSHLKPLVPDMLLSLDIEVPHDWHEKVNRSYFLWEFGKAPEAVVEIVSNTVGKELDEKLRRYALMDASYYVVFDPLCLLSDDVLRVYERGFARRYRRRSDYRLPDLGLSLTLWEGVFEDVSGLWIRWCDAEGMIIPTGAERAAVAEERAVVAEDQAAQAEAENAQLRAELERLRAQLNTTT